MGAKLFCPYFLSSLSRPEEKTGNVCKKNKDSGHILAFFNVYLITTKISLKTQLNHCYIDFLPPLISIQNGCSIKLSKVIALNNAIATLNILANTKIDKMISHGVPGHAIIFRALFKYCKVTLSKLINEHPVCYLNYFSFYFVVPLSSISDINV